MHAKGVRSCAIWSHQNAHWLAEVAARGLRMITRTALVFLAATAEAAGDASCPCITSYPAGVDTTAVKLAGATYSYPSNYGLSTCAKHDENEDPYCTAVLDGAAVKPAWCTHNWCYIDTATCTKSKSLPELLHSIPTHNLSLSSFPQPTRGRRTFPTTSSTTRTRRAATATPTTRGSTPRPARARPSTANTTSLRLPL